MPDYSKGKIYTIRFYDNENLIYIGSTIQTLAKRFGGHKKKTRCSLYSYIQEHYKEDFKCCYIELLELFGCKNREELDQKEGEIIRNFKADENYIVINKNIAGRNNEQYRQENRDKLNEIGKQYYQDNIDKIKVKKKQYRQENTDRIKQYYKENTDKIKEKTKQYYQENTTKIKEQKKQYRQENADKIKETYKQYRQESADKIKQRRKQYYLKKKAEAK